MHFREVEVAAFPSNVFGHFIDLDIPLVAKLFALTGSPALLMEVLNLDISLSSHFRCFCGDVGLYSFLLPALAENFLMFVKLA